jgi:hypothetical protein
MFLALFGVGLLTTAAGIVSIGFGVPINSYSFGNTLILSGTAAFVGGFILIGLAVEIGQLNRLNGMVNRLADVIKSQPVARPAPTESAERMLHSTAHVPAPPARTATPSPKPPEVTLPRPVVAKLRSPAATDSAGLPDWLRSKAKTTSNAPLIAPGPAVVDGPDNAPLSPSAPQRSAISQPPYSIWPERAQSVEPRDGGAHEAPKGVETEMPVPPSRVEHVVRVTPATYGQKDVAHKDAAQSAAKDDVFDIIWPDTRYKPLFVAEPGAREAGSELPSASRPREEKHFEPSPERPVEILKSGVVCGMAYTFYADGSIEAELAQGIVKFASVEALRAHLQKSN